MKNFTTIESQTNPSCNVELYKLLLERWLEAHMKFFVEWIFSLLCFCTSGSLCARQFYKIFNYGKFLQDEAGCGSIFK
jgi:hypothetical protein